MISLKSHLLSQSSDVHGEGNFFQGCHFSPDGLCVLTSTAGDAKLRLYNTVYQRSDPNVPDEWKPEFTIAAGDVVRSYAWYPQMSSQNPATCCFAATSRYVVRAACFGLSS